MDEDRVMDLVEDKKLFPTFVSHMKKHYQWYHLDTLKASAIFLSHVMASESFVTEPGRYLINETVKKNLLALKSSYIGDIVEKKHIKKFDIQKLWDNLSSYEKELGPVKIMPLDLD